MKMLYKLIDDGKLSKVELASLYDGEELIGDLQINYHSNGIKNMAQIEGRARAYVCRGQTCSLPQTNPAYLRAALTAPAANSGT